MALNFLTKENCTRAAKGDPKKIILAALITGLGTAMHALPALAQMISEGYEITVNCKEFQRPIYEAIGCKTLSMREPFGMAWYLENEKEYGKIISLACWDIWELRQYGGNRTGTMEIFADILGTDLPEKFSWIETLNVECVPQDYILFAPNSLERWRTLPATTACAIESELQDFGEVIRLEGNECKTWQELSLLIANASCVVAVEGGVLNVAGALNKKMLAITGVTEIQTTIEQYRRYIPDLEYREVQGFQPFGCSMPCMRRADRGFINDKCLGLYSLPQCLSKLDISKVTKEFSILKGIEYVVN